MHWSDLPNWLSGVLIVATFIVIWFAWRTARETRKTLVAEVRLQRLVHVSRLSDVLIAIVRDAHGDSRAPPPPAAGSQRPSVIPPLQAQLRAEMAVFRALGGPRS